MFPLFAATLGILGASFLTSTPSYVVLTPTPAYVNAGQDVVIAVEAVANTPVNTVDIEVAFPQDQLKILSVDTGGSVITLWTADPKIEGNKVILSGGVFRQGFLGRHLIAQIRAKAISNGQADVLVRNSMFLAGDGKGTILTMDTKNNTNAAVQIGKSLVVANGATLSGKIAVQVITDIDGNKKVDIKDIEAFMHAWSIGNAVYDFDGDGKMTFRDFAIILSDAFFK